MDPSKIHDNPSEIHRKSIPKSISNPSRIPKIHQNPSRIHPEFHKSIKIHLESTLQSNMACQITWATVIPNSTNPSKSISNPAQLHQFLVFPGHFLTVLPPEAPRRRVPKPSARGTSTTRLQPGFRACAKPWPSERRR